MVEPVTNKGQKPHGPKRKESDGPPPHFQHTPGEKRSRDDQLEIFPLDAAKVEQFSRTTACRIL